MASLRILLTSCELRDASGAVMYVHDVARELLARGHQPFVYSPRLGDVAQRITMATIGVVSDLASIHVEPDIIHAHHSLETLQALLHFPNTPAIYVCHDWSAVHDKPPKLPRIRKFVAVDDTVRDRLVFLEGIPERDVKVIFNGVNLQRFLPRTPLPSRAERALAISNKLKRPQLDILRAACEAQGIQLDAVGKALGGRCENPEELIGQYDLVFAKGRCAWESLAVGAAVIVCDTWGVGPLVTLDQLPNLRRANFGRRLLQQPLQPEVVSRQIARYDAQDASEVSRQIRISAGLETTVAQLLDVYHEAIAAHRAAPTDPQADMRAAAAFLQIWPSLQPPPPAPAVTVRESRHITREELQLGVREELRRARQSTGLRKLLRSIRKRLPRIVGGRRAA